MAANPKVLKRDRERNQQDKQKEKDERRRQRKLEKAQRATEPKDEMADIVPSVLDGLEEAEAPKI